MGTVWPPTYGSSLERLVTYINVLWLPSDPEQGKIRLILWFIGIGIVLNTHPPPRKEVGPAPYQYTMETIQSQTLCLSSGSGCCGKKGTKAKQLKPFKWHEGSGQDWREDRTGVEESWALDQPSPPSTDHLAYLPSLRVSGGVYHSTGLELKLGSNPSVSLEPST